MLELRAFAVGRKGNLAAALSERLKHLPDAVKGFDPWQILGFVDLSLSLQDLLSLGLAKPGFDDLKGLVAVKPGVKLQGRIRDLQAGLIKCLLKAAQVLRHAVDERALDVKYITGEHFQTSLRNTNPMPEYMSRERNWFLVRAV